MGSSVDCVRAYNSKYHFILPRLVNSPKNFVPVLYDNNVSKFIYICTIIYNSFHFIYFSSNCCSICFNINEYRIRFYICSFITYQSVFSNNLAASLLKNSLYFVFKPMILTVFVSCTRTLLHYFSIIYLCLCPFNIINRFFSC